MSEHQPKMTEISEKTVTNFFIDSYIIPQLYSYDITDRNGNDATQIVQDAISTLKIDENSNQIIISETDDIAEFLASTINDCDDKITTLVANIIKEHSLRANTAKFVRDVLSHSDNIITQIAFIYPLSCQLKSKHDKSLLGLLEDMITEFCRRTISNYSLSLFTNYVLEMLHTILDDANVVISMHEYEEFMDAIIKEKLKPAYKEHQLDDDDYGEITDTMYFFTLDNEFDEDFNDEEEDPDDFDDNDENAIDFDDGYLDFSSDDFDSEDNFD